MPTGPLLAVSGVVVVHTYRGRLALSTGYCYTSHHC